MPYLTNLADVARRTGYPVTEVAGWKSRGHGPQPSVQGIVCHHTAGRNDMHVVRDGRPGLTGPLSQFWLRSEEHTSELQSRENLVCRLLLEKKKHIEEDQVVR